LQPTGNPIVRIARIFRIARRARVPNGTALRHLLPRLERHPRLTPMSQSGA
jgi:hypothetical protein